MGIQAFAAVGGKQIERLRSVSVNPSNLHNRGLTMARKVVNRKELREEAEAAERLGVTKKKAVKKKAAVRKSRKKTAKEVRLKAFWGVFSQSLTQVAMFEYTQRKEADKKAEDLTESKKSPHFVQMVKKVIEE
jgi:hypothetical protein